MTGVTIYNVLLRTTMTFVMVHNRLPHIFMPINLLQHGYFTFLIMLFGLFARLFINLTLCIWALFTKKATTLGLVEQAFWRVPLFTERVVASSFQVIFARPSKHSSTETLASGTSGSRRISLILLHERTWWRIGLEQYLEQFFWTRLSWIQIIVLQIDRLQLTAVYCNRRGV